MTTRSLKSEFTYLGHLIEAGWNGVLSSRGEPGNRVFPRLLACYLLAPTALGAGVGALSVSLRNNRRSGNRWAAAGLLGSLAGFSAAMAWSSRRVAAPAARNAMRNINTVRDARWLETHPIDYA
jgi:hypothetical protein